MRPVTSMTGFCSGLDREGAGVIAADEDGQRVRLRVHVAGALPGERVVARLEHVSPHRGGDRRDEVDAWATLDRLETTSPFRVEPACPGFGSCGGCVLQHLAYEEQVRWKRARVEETLAARPTLARVPVDACVPSPQPLGYRNQAKYVCGRDAGGRLVLGAYAPRSHRVIDLLGCRVVEPVLDHAARALRDILEAADTTPFDERTRTGELRYAILRSNHAGEVLATLVTAGPSFPPGPTVAAALMRTVPAVLGVVQNVNPSQGNALFGTEAERVLAGQAFLSDTLGPIEVRLSSRSFFQINRGVAALAYDRLIAAVEEKFAPGGHGHPPRETPLDTRVSAGGLRPADRAVDAYSGAGGIALRLAPFAREVVAIEQNPAATSMATTPSAKVRFVTADAAHGLAGLDHADLVVLNPPRAGCSQAVLSEIGRLRPKMVLYMSCNPHSLARDLDHLLGLGFRTTRITPFDMLPHTPHVEAVAVLTPATALP